MPVTRTTEIITPKQAERLLQTVQHKKNRIIRDANVDRLAQDMIEGRFKYNGDTIRIDEDGDLMDGQHRLSAIVKSGLPQRMDVVRGLPREVMSTIDIGEPRNAASWLQIRGYENANTLAAASKLLEAYLEAKLHVVTSRGKYSGLKAEQMVKKYPGIQDSVKHTRRLYDHGALRETVGSRAACALFHYLFSEVDVQKADIFFERLSTGENLSKTDPIYELREQLLKFSGSKKIKMTQAHTFALIIKAWNAFYEGRQIKALKYAKEEKFPSISGDPFGV